MMANAAAPSRRRGRPAKPAEARKRNNLTMRLRDETKAALEREAARHQRSVSEEIEAIVEQALRESKESQAEGLGMLLTRIAGDVGGYAGFSATGSLEGASNWLSNPYAFDQVARGIKLALEALRPKGGAEVPSLVAQMGDEFARGIGEGFARGALDALRRPDSGGELGHWARRVRDRLGPLATSRVRV